MTQRELESLWVEGALPSVAFPFDTRVRAIAGEHVGRHGRVVALLPMEPSPLYVVEEPEGTSFNAQQSELESVDLPERARAQLHLRHPHEAFQSGQRIAYYAVMSLLISQAKSFDLPIEDLHLEGLEPDRDLLVMAHPRSNQSVELTATRPTLTLFMTKPLSARTTLALGGGSSLLSR